MAERDPAWPMFETRRTIAPSSTRPHELNVGKVECLTRLRPLGELER